MITVLHWPQRRRRNSWMGASACALPRRPLWRNLIARKQERTPGRSSASARHPQVFLALGFGGASQKIAPERR